MLAALLMALTGQPPLLAQAGDGTEALVRRMQAAVEAGRDSVERRRLLRRRTPGPSDRTTLLALATLDRFTYRDDDAERGYSAVMKGNRDELAAYALLGLGWLRMQHGRLADADPLLRRSAQWLERNGNRSGAAQGLIALGISTSRTVGLDSALKVFASAVRVVPAEDVWLRSLLDCNIIMVRVRKVEPGAATLARPAAERAKRAGNLRAAATCIAALAQDYERRTLVDSSLATFTEVAALHRAAQNLFALAAVRQWQGFVLLSGGRYPEARAALDEAIALGERARAPGVVSWASLTLADFSLTFGDLSSAGSHARKAVAMFELMGDRWGTLITRLHSGDVALLSRSFATARVAYERVARDAPDVSPPVGVHALGRLASMALLEGDAGEAVRQLDAARPLAAALNMPEWRQEDRYIRALVALQRGQFAESEEILQQLRRILPPGEMGHVDALTRLAEVHVRAGELDRAEADLESAGKLVDQWRAALPQRELRAAVLQARRFDWDRDLSFATVIHQIAQGGRAAAAFKLTEQRRARVILEELARHQSLSVKPVDSLALPSAFSDVDIRRVLPDSTAVMSFLTGRGGEPTTVFVLTREGVAAASAEPIDDHMQEIERFVGLVSSGDVPFELSQALGRAFLAAGLTHVPPHIRRLVLVPDGALHRIPFDLLDAGDGKLLIDRFELSRAPSASVAATWWSSPPRAAQRRLLAFGDPVGVMLSGASGDSVPPRLPAAAAEVQRIARYASRSDVFIGAEAGETRLSNADLRDVGVLHFATHAQVDEWSLLHSSLMLAPGGGEDGHLGVEELVGMRVNANLVVLSACRSAGGAVLAGEGLQGLTEPFLEAGAAAVVASLWQIGDRSAAPMMDLFYRQLASGASVGTALHRAKQSARRQGISPGVWAAFTVTGDARVQTALRRPFPYGPLVAGSVFMGLLAIVYSFWRTNRRKADRR